MTTYHRPAKNSPKGLCGAYSEPGLDQFSDNVELINCSYCKFFYFLDRVCDEDRD